MKLATEEKAAVRAVLTSLTESAIYNQPAGFYIVEHLAISPANLTAIKKYLTATQPAPPAFKS
jgi:hypothetical protein